MALVPKPTTCHWWNVQSQASTDKRRNSKCCLAGISWNAPFHHNSGWSWVQVWLSTCGQCFSAFFCAVSMDVLQADQTLWHRRQTTLGWLWIWPKSKLQLAVNDSQSRCANICVPASLCMLASKHALQLLWDCAIDPLHSLLKSLSMHLYGLLHFLLSKST